MKRHDLSPGTLGLLGVLLAFFAVFLAYPVGFMLQRAFQSPQGFTLQHFSLLLASPLQREALGNSLLIGAFTTVLTTLIALPLAHFTTRYRFPGKSILSALLLVPMIMPPFVGAIGLKQLLGRFGSLNLLLAKLGLISADHAVNWLGGGGFWGVVVLQSLSLYPILLLNLSAAMANLDPTLREAGQNLGAGGWHLFRTVTLPLIAPGYFAGATVVFIWAFTDLGTPLVFGLSRVTPVQIFDSMTELNTNPMGYALVVTVLLLTLGLFLASKRMVSGNRYAMMARGSSAGAQTNATRGETALIWGGAGALVVVALLPHLAVVVQSLAARWYFTILPEGWTLAHFREVTGQPMTANGIRRSLLYSSLSSSLDLVVGLAIAWLLTRRKIPFAWLLDVLAMLPLAVPGLVIAFGYVAAFDWKVSWLNPRTDPTLLLVVSYSVRRLPYIVRSAYAGLQQTSVTLEEASANLGAGPWLTLRRVTLPLVAANLVAGTVLTFAFAMLEVSDSLILAMSEAYYPITKTLYALLGRIEPDAPSIACALGVVGMAILAGSLLVASRILGRRMGQLFRA